MNDFFNTLAKLFQPEIKTRQCLDGPHPDILGEDSIKIGDKFSGYACGNYFTNQTCRGFTSDGLIMGTTTLAVFDKKNIIKK